MSSNEKPETAEKPQGTPPPKPVAPAISIVQNTGKKPGIQGTPPKR